MGLEVDRDEPLEQCPPGGIEVAAGFEVVGQAAGLVEGPGLEGGHELALVDDPILQREESEEEMTVGIGGHGEAPVHGVAPAKPDRGHGARSRGERRDVRIIA